MKRTKIVQMHYYQVDKLKYKDKKITDTIPKPSFPPKIINKSLIVKLSNTKKSIGRNLSYSEIPSNTFNELITNDFSKQRNKKKEVSLPKLNLNKVVLKKRAASASVKKIDKDDYIKLNPDINSCVRNGKKINELNKMFPINSGHYNKRNEFVIETINFSILDKNIFPHYIVKEQMKFKKLFHDFSSITKISFGHK